MPYSNINDVPRALKTAGLNLSQANEWASYYDALKKQPGITSAAAVAWKQFKKKYYKSGETWHKKKSIKVEKKIKKNKEKTPLFNPLIKFNKKIQEEVMEKEIKGYEFLYRNSPKPISLEDVDAEGVIYEKELIREGEWAHPQDSKVRLKITLARMKKWIANFNKQLFKVPVPKRHSLDPEDNRGWVKKLFLRKNKEGKHVLFGHLDITNDTMKEAINNGDVQDVSVSVSDYMDNTGKRHGETLQHVALTVIPHIDGQSGFSPVSAEGILCLEEVNTEIITQEDLEAPAGSDEQEKEKLTKAITIARMFPEPDKFYIVGTYKDRVIVQYYGGGTGDTGMREGDRFFNIPYTIDLNKKYVFGDKEELSKKYYFIDKTYDNDPEVAAEKVKKQKELETENKMEVKDMEQLEKLQAEHVVLEKEKVDLETKVAGMEPKIVELEKAKENLETSNKEMKDQLGKIEAEKKTALEKEVEGKVSKLVEDGNILPAEKDDVKAVMLEGGKAAEILTTTLKDRKAVDLSTKSKTDLEKPSNKKDVDPKKEAQRIIDGK